jgi:hypothetical protein
MAIVNFDRQQLPVEQCNVSKYVSCKSPGNDKSHPALSNQSPGHQKEPQGAAIKPVAFSSPLPSG